MLDGQFLGMLPHEASNGCLVSLSPKKSRLRNGSDGTTSASDLMSQTTRIGRLHGPYRSCPYNQPSHLWKNTRRNPKTSACSYGTTAWKRYASHWPPTNGVC